MDELLTKEQCKRILQNYTGTEETSLHSYVIRPVTQLNGYIADASIITIRYSSDEGTKELRAFAKALKNSNPFLYKLSLEMKAYEREAFFYTQVLPSLDCKDFAPKCYLSENFVVVLEDLAELGYTSFAKGKPFDLNDCKACLQTLAKFHAYPIIHEIEKSKELGRTYKFSEEGCLDSLLTNNNIQSYFHYGVKGLCELVDYMKEIEWDKNMFKSKIMKVVEMLWSFEGDSGRSTIIHGDLWGSNFMVRESGDGELSCLLIDFQTVQYGPPASDVMQFFYSNTTRSFREQHQEELLNYYYTSFSELLKAKQLDPVQILSESEFTQACEVYALPTMVFSVVDRCITSVSDEDHRKAFQSEESFRRFLYEDRGKYNTKSYEESREFRERILEDIEGINEMLLSVE